MFEFTLDDGTKVQGNHFFVAATYSGLLEGDPSKSTWINEGIIKRLHCPSEWGNRKTHLISPVMRDGFLPPAIYTVWLDSNSTSNPAMHGSELVVIWLGDVPGERNISSIIHEGVRSIKWKQLAQDFQY